MAVTVVERFESRTLTVGNSPSAELRFVVNGTNDDAEAMTELLAAAPASYDPWGSGILYLPRESVRLEPIGDKLWEGVVSYGPVQETNSSSFEFDTGGGTQHITQSKQTIAKYPTGAADFKGAIGVTSDSVEGVDITVPVYHFAETHYKPDSAVTSAYKTTLFALTGKTNSASFKGFAVGEVLFLGAAGSKRGSGDWEITFRFAASPNVSNLTIGDITGINKKGWEYLWVRYIDVEDTSAKVLTKRPLAVYIERVYDSGDMSLLGIGT